EAAKAFLENMPTIEDLVMPIASLKLPSGEVFLLEDQQARNALVTPERNGVTVTEAGVHKSCAACGKPLASGRGLYCSNACRQKGHRQRHSTGHPQPKVAVMISVLYRDSDDYGDGEHWEHLGDVETQEAAMQLRDKHMRENHSNLSDYRILDPADERHAPAEGLQ